ncbi:hypothetical protein [Sodalis sp. RH22]|uniref:hypothetical protein n=1 Tax=unclassified Sodalis (in: enterobacteria) TaxID=2636512 RepID=UPI0039B47F84
MRKIIFSFIILLLSSCATVSDLRENAPIVTGESSKSSSDYAACVAAKWGETHYTVTSVPIKNGIAIMLPNSTAGVDAVVDIVNVDKGVSYKLYERAPSLTPKRIDDAITSCK